MSFLDIDIQKNHIRWSFVIMIVICFFIIRYTVLSKPMIKDYILSQKEYNIFNFLAQEKQKSLKSVGSYKDLRLYTNLGITAYGEEPTIENFSDKPLGYSKFIPSCEDTGVRKVDYEVKKESKFELPTPYDYIYYKKDNLNSANNKIPRKSVNIEMSVPSEKIEISSETMIHVLNEILSKTNQNTLDEYKQLKLNEDYFIVDKQNLEIREKLNTVYDEIVDSIVTDFNIIISDYVDCGVPVITCYEDNCIFKSVNQFIISAGYSEDKNIFIIDGHLDLHRINKAYTFGVYCKVYYDANKNTIVYSDLKLNTMSWENSVYMLPGIDHKNKSSSSNLRIYKPDSNCELKDEKQLTEMACETNKFCCGYFARNEDETVTPYVSETTYGNEEYNDKIIDKSTYSESELEKLKKYPIEYIDSDDKDNYDDGICLGKYASNKYVCKSKYDNLGRFVGAGIWDKKCTSNEDCPFYKKNKNYENDRGGCIDGFCELPLNMELVGFKNYEKNKNPYCHNCKDPSEYECCEDQNNRNEYPDLKSPDYMFENDRNDRL